MRINNHYFNINYLTPCVHCTISESTILYYLYIHCCTGSYMDTLHLTSSFTQWTSRAQALSLIGRSVGRSVHSVQLIRYQDTLRTSVALKATTPPLSLAEIYDNDDF